MIQHIAQLFEETKTIILPGLGALTITNPDTGELMFMPYLKHNDGVLKGFIASKEGISEDDAQSKMTAAIAEIQSKLDNGSPAPFGSFGHFQKDADGDVEFVNQTEASSENTPTPETKEAATAIPTAEETDVPVTETPDVEPETAELPDEAPSEPEVVTTPPEIAEDDSASVATETTAPEAIAPIVEATSETTNPPENTSASTPKTLADEIAAAEQEKAATPVEESNEEIPTATSTPLPEEKEEAPVTKPTKTIAEEIEEAEKAKAMAATASTPETPVAETITHKDSQKELNILEKEEIASNQKKLDDLRAQKEAPKKRKKRGAGFYILLILVFIVVGGGTFVGLNYDQFKEYLPFESNNAKLENKSDAQIKEMQEMIGDTEEETPDTQETVDTTSTATTDMEEIPEEPATVDPPVEIEAPKQVISGSNNQPFHIIAGAFGSPENADRLANKIQGMGYPAKTIVRGDKTLVSVQSYATRAEAQAAISTVKDAAPSGWILEWRN